MQEALFHEKQTIIENCLFGVDINANSVKICRLRLWIELLKNAYYKAPSSPFGGGRVGALETLPNIDINIKCGNSLISRFAIDADLGKALKKSKWTIDSYKIAVDTYRNAENKEQKREMERLIADIKSDFRTEISLNDPKIKKLKKLKGDLINLTTQQQLFGMDKKEKDRWNKQVQKLTKETEKLEAEIETIKANKIFENAFEWRFEFPEVLNDNGDFMGFDVVIGNPPYVDIKALDAEQVKYYFSTFTTTSNRINLYSIFVELGYSLLCKRGQFIFIIPNSILVNSSYQEIRELIGEEIYSIVKLPDRVFHDAIVETIILSFQKAVKFNFINVIRYANDDAIGNIDNNLRYKVDKAGWQSFEKIKFNIYLTNTIQKIVNKCHQESSSLGTIADFSLGITPYDKYKGHSQELIKKKLFHNKIKIDETCKPLIEGANIKRFKITEDIKEYIRYGNWLGAPREERFFTQPRVIVRQIVSGAPPRIYAGYTDKSLYFTQIGFAIIPNNDLSPKALTVLLNSTLINFLHKYLYLDIEKELFQKILIENCKKFPIKKIDQATQTILENKLDNYLEGRTDIGNIQSEIDQLVYQLYGLTEEEIVLVESTMK